MDADLSSILTGGLATAANNTLQRISVLGESSVQGLNTVQTLGVQLAHAAALSSTVMADDAQAMGGLRTAIHIPEKDKG